METTCNPHDGTRFLTALFAPGDIIAFRPIETYLDETGKKAPGRVDYDGVTYHTIGLGVGRNGTPGKCVYVPFPARTESMLARAIERSYVERTNIFMGTSPRFAAGDRYASYDLKWQIRTIRSLWADVDDTGDVSTVLARCAAGGVPPPSIVVHSGHGVHLYWLLSEPVVINDAPDPPPVFAEFVDQGEGKKKRRRLWIAGEKPGERLYIDVPTHEPRLSPKAQSVEDTLVGIAAVIGGDKTTDLCRILRVPGTLNRKNERNGKPPVPCSLAIFEPGRRYQFSEFARFEQTSPKRIDRQKIACVPLPKRGKGRIGNNSVRKLDSLITDCVAADDGTRSEVDFHLCCWAVEQGYPADEIWQRVGQLGKFAENGRRYFDLTWDAACEKTRQKLYDEARAKLTHKAVEKEKTEHQEGKDGQDHPIDAKHDEITEADDDPHRLARVNLARYAARSEGRRLRYWRSEWYVWKRNRYKKIPTDEFRAKLTQSIREEFERVSCEKGPGEDGNPVPIQKVTTSLTLAVLQATSGLPEVCLSSDIEPGTWLSDRQQRNWLSMTNGIIDIDAILANRDTKDCTRPNSADWFSTVSLPYAFDPAAKCPKFDAFLEHNLEMDPERIKILQEWAGYLLLPDTGEQAFMILEGEGKNGKSVYIAALTAMLGTDNVSNVPLEKFGDRFSLTTTLGRLMNAAGDCGEIDKASEGDLKSFVSGDRMMFDRKGLSPIECAPTARLMLACNNRPRFSDKTDGIWRRMQLVPWRVQINKTKRVRGMDKVGWWQRSGELPGILNWALEGLARLRAQNGFTESAMMQQAIRDYQEEMNPTKVFLTEFCEVSQDACIRSSVLYRLYRKWIETSGHKPLSDKFFGREVKRVFPTAEKRQKQDGGCKIWVNYGLKFSQDEICGEKVEDFRLF